MACSYWPLPSLWPCARGGRPRHLARWLSLSRRGPPPSGGSFCVRMGLDVPLARAHVPVMRPILVVVLCLAVATIVVLMLSAHFALRLWL